MKNTLIITNPNRVSLKVKNEVLSLSELRKIVYRHFKQLSEKYNVFVFEEYNYNDCRIVIEGSSKRINMIVDLRTGYLISTLKRIKKSIIACGSLPRANELQEIINDLVELRKQLEKNYSKKA